MNKFGTSWRRQGYNPKARFALKDKSYMANILNRIVYRRKSLVLKEDVTSLRQIYATSIKNNNRDRISGCFAQPDGHFVQVIEGRAEKVHRLMRGSPPTLGMRTLSFLMNGLFRRDCSKDGTWLNLT